MIQHTYYEQLCNFHLLGDKWELSWLFHFVLQAVEGQIQQHNNIILNEVYKSNFDENNSYAHASRGKGGFE